MDSPLILKSKQFALDIIKICNRIKKDKRECVLTNQLIRSGTSIGANIREAFYGHGRNDFIAKLQIALKECSESEYWPELLIESGYYEDKTILDNCTEIKKILIASINTAKKKIKISIRFISSTSEWTSLRSDFSVYKNQSPENPGFNKTGRMTDGCKCRRSHGQKTVFLIQYQENLFFISAVGIDIDQIIFILKFPLDFVTECLGSVFQGNIAQGDLIGR